MEKIIGYIGLGALILFVIAYIVKFVLLTKTHSFLNNPEKDKTRCKKCKTNMDIIVSKLYLIPAFFEDEHEESPAYYLENAQEIATEEDIPSGRRACYMKVFRCPSCGIRHVEVSEFLRTSTMKTLHNFGIYEYEQLQELLER